MLQHNHNHTISVAGAVRFRPISEETKSISLNKATPQVVDRNINPKISDVYNYFNKWRKDNLEICTEKELFIGLEKRVNIYIMKRTRT